VVVPEHIALPVIRRQANLPDGFQIAAKTVNGRVLDLRKHALPEDISSAGEIARKTYLDIPDKLAEFIRFVGTVDFGKNGETRRVWQLSAVSPNIRRQKVGDSFLPKFWYMLPDFTSRHAPDLFIARIVSSHPKAFLNEGRKTLVDANFSTIWVDKDCRLDAYSLLAIFNCSWCRAALELSATVMGGGALKIEAGHLRRLPIPNFDHDEVKKLSSLGKSLAQMETPKDVKKLLSNIDKLVVKALLGRAPSPTQLKTLTDLADASLIKREQHQKKGRTSDGKRTT